LATLGGVLEFYDFIIFVFFANTIGDLFFPPGIPDWVRQFQTFGIFAAGYLARPLGGVVMAHAGDLHGRKKMFTLSVFLMALPTLGIGLLPTYANLGVWASVLLLLLRILQGAAVGGEVPGAEHVPPSRIGLACGVLTAGLTGGILLGSLVALRAVVRDHRAAIVLSGLLTWMLSAAIVVVILMTPALLQKMYSIQSVATLQANCVATIWLTAGCVLAG
jgi:MFS family permease